MTTLIAWIIILVIFWPVIVFIIGLFVSVSLVLANFSYAIFMSKKRDEFIEKKNSGTLTGEEKDTYHKYMMGGLLLGAVTFISAIRGFMRRHGKN